MEPDGRTGIPALCYLLQEVAGNNALQLDFDISQLQEQNLTWMLHRLHLQMDRLPAWRDRITIRTWPSGGDRLRAYRDFSIRDDNEHEIGRCVSYWLMLNLDTRRPVRIPPAIQQMGGGDDEHLLPLQKQRLAAEAESDDGAVTFRVRRSDLDMNRHVNNVKYIEWALARLPEDKEVCEIDIEFRAECTEGQSIRSVVRSGEADGRHIHHLIRGDEQTVAALAVSRTA